MWQIIERLNQGVTSFSNKLKSVLLGKCIYCHNDVGFFGVYHRECHQTYENGKKQIMDLIVESLAGPSAIDRIPEQISTIGADSFISIEEQHDLAVCGWEKAVDSALEHDVISEAEERNLIEFEKRMSLSIEELNRNGAHRRAAQSGLIRDLLNDVIRDRVDIVGDLPNLQKGEKVVWMFDASYFQDRTHRHYEGASLGFSVRIAKGFYMRSGAFRGDPIDTTERALVDRGNIIATNKNLHFSGQHGHDLRIPYSKILAFRPFSNGIAVIRDARTAKPLIFEIDDAAFAYNVLTNLARISSNS